MKTDLIDIEILHEKIWETDDKSKEFIENVAQWVRQKI